MFLLKWWVKELRLHVKWGTRVLDLQMEKSGPILLVLDNSGNNTVNLVVSAEGSLLRIRQWLIGEEVGKLITLKLRDHQVQRRAGKGNPSPQ